MEYSQNVPAKIWIEKKLFKVYMESLGLTTVDINSKKSKILLD